MSTAIYIGQQNVRMLAKNQDVPYEGAYIFTNERGVAKQALVQPPARAAQWVSRYGSVTVSQVGKEMPNGGMNEAGLVVEQTTLWQSTYPEDDNLAAIGELQWIQLLLDTCVSVQEAIVAASKLRIAQPMSRLHYMLADRTGDCAVIEFIDNRMQLYRSDSLPVPIMANTSYAAAIRDLEDANEHWRSAYSDYDRNSMERFVKGAAYIADEPSAREKDQLELALEALQAVRREDTAYSFIYDLQLLQLHFISNLYPQLKTVRLSELDFSRDAVALALNVQQPADKDGKAGYQKFDTTLNFTIAHSFFRNPLLSEAFGWMITDEMIDFFSAFPEQFPSVADV